MIISHGRDVGVTLSAGLDSTVLAYWFCENYKKLEYLSPTPFPKNFKQKVRLIFANIGNQANAEVTHELFHYHFAQLSLRYPSIKFKKDYLKIPLPDWATKGNPIHQQGGKPLDEDYRPNIRNHEDLGPNVYIDGRNTLVLGWILSWCSYKKVPLLLVGHQSEIHEFDDIDTYRGRTDDNSCLIIDRMNLLNEVGYRTRTRIEAPFSTLRYSKYDIVKVGMDLGINLGSSTYSCLFSPPCGKCGQCVIRRKAFAIFGIEEKFK